MERAIGGYRLFERLGRGGAGSVYRGQAPDGSVVAIKLLYDGRPLSAYERARFEVEARALTRLDHPGVVAVETYGVDAERAFLVLELIEGESLDAVLERSGPLPIPEATALAVELAVILAAVHERGVIHRDVKPANVMLDQARRPRLTDFGLAKDLHSSLTGPTRTGAFLGTPGFWAPEQVSGEGAVDPRADVYAVGATLYALLTGRPPVEGQDLTELLVATATRPPTPPSRHRPEVGPRLEAVVLRCLAKAPRDRYPSAAELAGALQGLSRSAEPPARSAGRTAGAALVGLGLLVAAAIIASAGPVGRGPASPGPSAAPSDLANEPDGRDPAASREAVLRAEAHLKAGRLEPAREELQRARTLDPAAARPLLVLAEAALHADASEEALGFADRYLLLEPDDPNGYELRGLAYAGLGRWRQARDAFTRVLETSAADVDGRAFAGRARAAFELGELAAAARDYEAAITRRPRSDPDRRSWEQTYDRVNAALHPEVHPQYLQALEAGRAGRDAESLRLLTAAFDADPDHGGVIEQLATLLSGMRRPQEALTVFDHGIGLSPENLDLRVGRAFATGMLPNAAPASRDVEHLLAADSPPHVRSAAYLVRATVAEGQGRADDAIADYEQALRLDGGMPQASTRLGLLLVEQHAWARAEPALTQGLTRNPGLMRELALLARARCRLALGRHQEARADLEAALETLPPTGPLRAEAERALAELTR